jgi:hypothetical protein
MLIRQGISGQRPIQTTTPPPIATGPQTPVDTSQSPNDSVPDEKGVPRFRDGLIDFAKAMAPTLGGAAIGALAGGGQGAMLGAQVGSSFTKGKAEEEQRLAKVAREQSALDAKNQIAKTQAETAQIQAQTAQQRAAKTGGTPKYFQSGNVVLKVNPDGTQEQMQVGKQKGQFIQIKDANGATTVMIGDPETGELTEAYKNRVTETPRQAISKYNTAVASITDKLVGAELDVAGALEQAQLQAKANGIEWTPQEAESKAKIFTLFEVPARKRAFENFSGPMQTEVLKQEAFLDAVDAVDALLDNPVVQDNLGLVPGALTELTAKLNSGALEPEQQAFFSSLKNAFDLLVRNRTGAAMSMSEEQFYNSLFGNTRGSKENLLVSLDVQRQAALNTIENAYENGPVTYVEADPKRMTNDKIKQILAKDPDNPPADILTEFRRRIARGLIF